MFENGSWSPRSLDRCFDVLTFPGKPKILTRDYQPTGRFPVVDQGQRSIAGWTDSENALIDSPLPVIVFGDHTRALKFVDFPFARGADGTQILKPTDDIDPLFLYYACRSLDLPSRGYNRHLSLLKEQVIALPTTRDEQLAVGRVLRMVETASEHQTTLAMAAQRLKHSAMREMFTRGPRGEPQKESEIGPVPESWDVFPLGDHHSVGSGGTPSRSVPEYWNGGTIPWVKTTEVNYCVIRDAEERITPAGLENSAAKLLSPGTLLMAMYGQGVTRGKVAVLGVAAACNQACAWIVAIDERVDAKYLYHFLTYRYDAIRQLAHGGQQQNLNLDIVRALPVAVPNDGDTRRSIVAILDAIDSKIDVHHRKRDLLDRLFKSLLQKLMASEIRVSDLDLSALLVPAEVRP